MLICPVCKKELKRINNQYKCNKNHSFDIAKQGYTNLYLKNSKNSGDNKEMVQARTSFLNSNHYLNLAEELIAVLKQINHDVIADAGCGEGYYTNLIQNALNNEIYAFDLSKEALKYASRNNKNIRYFLSSIFDLPLSSKSCDVVLNIFAPMALKEYSRVLKEGGYLIKVDPHVSHLKEMKEFLYENVYENEVFDLNVEGFTLESFKEVTYTMHLKKEEIISLFKMTPYYYHTKKEKYEKLFELDNLDCLASFIIYIYKKN